MDEIGFIWDLETFKWEENFAALLIFKEREGHCRPTSRHKEGELPLGNWIYLQQTNKDIMSSEHHQRLDEIGFNWDPLGRRR